MSTVKFSGPRDIGLKRHLFYETSHSPSLIDRIDLIDLVGYENAAGRTPLNVREG